MAKWQEELREGEEDESEADKTGDEKDDEDGHPASISVLTATAARIRRRGSSWLPTTLVNLFSGAIAQPFGRPARRAKVVSEEALYMELLAAEHSDEEPDAGKMRGLWRVQVTIIQSN
ncbi:hypothetical protein GGX14DRAFT_661302 [Mycena pura]|uniref:Uncharacterized protein n=1 Tax=Mycena pura TaxID=153505 RepID=A0AAD6V8B9_9AGAR|nr:hypothetical protein GGX14DRAFT_661302 [Mycena pura]